MNRQILAVAVLVSALAGTTGLALHYRQRARSCAAELAAAKADLARNQQWLADAEEAARREIQPALSSRGALPRSSPAPAIPQSETQAVAAIPAPTPPVPTDAAAAPTQNVRPSRAAWMDNLRTQDPQRYEELQKRQQEARDEIETAFARKADYFTNRDTSAMSESEKADYNRLLALLDQTWKLAGLMQTDLPRDQRHETMDTIRSNMAVMTPLMLDERNREFQDYARAMGLSAKDAATFAENMNAVIEATTLQNLFRGLMRGAPFGRGIFTGTPPPAP